MTVSRRIPAYLSQSSLKIGRRQPRCLALLLFVSAAFALRMFSVLDHYDDPKFEGNANMNIHRLSLPSPMYLQKRQEPNSQPGKIQECRRRCSLNRINKIVYLHNKRDGLSDRMYILTNLLNLAGYVCATVDVDKPSNMLATWHNQNQETFTSTTATQYESGGKRTDPEFRWSDFFNFTLQNEDEQSLITMMTRSSSQSSSIKLLQEIPVQPSSAMEYYEQSGAFDLKLVTDNPRDVFRHWKQIEKYSWQESVIPAPIGNVLSNDSPLSQSIQRGQRGGFVWIIGVNW